MTIAEPFFSIIIATYNCKKYLDQTIQSILNQNFTSYEIIIIDGQSSDGTIQIIGKYLNQITYFISEPDHGIYDAWNKALSIIKGEWIFFLGADDYLYDKKTLENVFFELNKNSSVFFAYGAVSIIDENEKIMHEIDPPDWEQVKSKFTQLNCLHHQGIFHNRNLFKKYGQFDSKFKIAGDYDMLLRSLKEKSPLKLKSKIAYARIGGISSNIKTAKKALLEIKHARNKNNFTSFPYLWYWQFAKLIIKLLLLNIFGKNLTHKISHMYKKFVLSFSRRI